MSFWRNYDNLFIDDIREHWGCNPYEDEEEENFEEGEE